MYIFIYYLHHTESFHLKVCIYKEYFVYVAGGGAYMGVYVHACMRALWMCAGVLLHFDAHPSLTLLFIGNSAACVLLCYLMLQILVDVFTKLGWLITIIYHQ